MSIIWNYLRRFTREINPLVFIFISVFTAILVFGNYYWGIDAFVRSQGTILLRITWWYFIFLFSFGIPFAFIQTRVKNELNLNSSFLVLLLYAPLVFAIKISIPITIFTGKSNAGNIFYNQIAYWPILLVITCLLLFIPWIITGKKNNYYGMAGKPGSWTPYLFLLGLMIPLIAIAATQQDFLNSYPKILTAEGMNFPALKTWQKVLFEFSYGSDFITIELFFRGFLVIGFIRYAGKYAVLPMACFYCVIHFGKPLAECISSYFGGMILGVIVYHTRNIKGGLLIHLGIAWMMEVAGYIAHQS